MADIALVMSQLGMFILTTVSGVFLYQFVILQLIYLLIVRANPLRFWFGLAQAWVTAWATASTAAALPVTFRCMRENNKVRPSIIHHTYVHTSTNLILLKHKRLTKEFQSLSSLLVPQSIWTGRLSL